ATVRGAVGSLAILLTDSRYQNVGGLKWTTPTVSPISSVVGDDEVGMSTALYEGGAACQMRRCARSWTTRLSWAWSRAQLSIASSREDQVRLGHRSGSASQIGPSMRPEEPWRLPERRVGRG